jgi:hypothetical protein
MTNEQRAHDLAVALLAKEGCGNTNIVQLYYDLYSDLLDRFNEYDKNLPVEFNYDEPIK